MGNAQGSSDTPLVAAFRALGEALFYARLAADAAALGGGGTSTKEARSGPTLGVHAALQTAHALACETPDPTLAHELLGPTRRTGEGNIAQDLIAILDGSASAADKEKAMRAHAATGDGGDMEAAASKRASPIPPVVPTLLGCLRVRSPAAQLAALKLLRHLFSANQRAHARGDYNHVCRHVSLAHTAPPGTELDYELCERFHLWLHAGVYEQGCRYAKELLISSDMQLVVEVLEFMSLLSEHPSTRTILIGIDILTPVVVLLQTNSRNDLVLVPALRTMANLSHCSEQLCTAEQHCGENGDGEIFQDMWKVEVKTVSVVDPNDNRHSYDTETSSSAGDSAGIGVKIEREKTKSGDATENTINTDEDTSSSDEDNDTRHENNSAGSAAAANQQGAGSGAPIKPKIVTKSKVITVCRTCALSCWKTAEPRYRGHMKGRCECSGSRGMGSCCHSFNLTGGQLIEKNLLPKLLCLYGMHTVSVHTLEELTRTVLNLSMSFFDPAQTATAPMALDAYTAQLAKGSTSAATTKVCAVCVNTSYTTSKSTNYRLPHSLLPLFFPDALCEYVS